VANTFGAVVATLIATAVLAPQLGHTGALALELGRKDPQAAYELLTAIDKAQPERPEARQLRERLSERHPGAVRSDHARFDAGQVLP
jgi:hypothetical protein